MRGNIAMKIKKSAGDIIADIIIYAVVGALSLICIIPFIHVLAVSISGDAQVYANNVWSFQRILHWKRTELLWAMIK